MEGDAKVSLDHGGWGGGSRCDFFLAEGQDVMHSMT